MNGVKIILASVWGLVISLIGVYMYVNGISFGEGYELVTSMIKSFVLDFGVWGGILYIFIYTFRPLLFFPATLLTTLSGALFGPVLGFVYTMIGENLSANFAFMISRYFRGEKVNVSSEWIKKIDKRVEKDGFMTTLMLRFLWAPFDGVNYGLGLTSIKQKDFALGTIIGIIPGALVFILLGNVLGNGSDLSVFQISLNIGLSVILFILSLLLSKYLKKKNKGLGDLE
jgi:uncharacterized membrane protein YdjX (TVP38/TMEM64 family)